MYYQQPDSSVPAFISKLWHMVCDNSTDNLICWGPDETSFIIKDEQRFCSELLPRYYKHSNMSSFIRQLNKYDFHKVMSAESLSLKSALEKNELEFVHPCFVKGHPYLLNAIKRKLSNTKEVSEYKGDHSVLQKLVNEVQQLQTKQEMVESKFLAMKNENDVLWREHAILKQKHQKQQQIVNKLIQFLVSLVRGVNIRGAYPLMVKDSAIQHVDGLKAIKAKGCPDNRSSPSICEVDMDGQPIKDNVNFSVSVEPKAASSKLIGKRKINLNGRDANIREVREVPKAKKLREVNKANKTEKKLSIPELSPSFDFNYAGSSASNFPIITSPSGGLMISPKSNECVDDNIQEVLNEPVPIKADDISQSDVSKNLLVTDATDPNAKPDTKSNDNNGNVDPGKTIALCNNTTDLKNDVDCHLDIIQSDLDALKDILHSDGLSIDASTIMSLFSDDALSYLPEDSSWNEDKLNMDESGSELVPYSTPNLLDMVNILENEEEAPELILPDVVLNDPDLDPISELNTPLPTNVDFATPPEVDVQHCLRILDYIRSLEKTRNEWSAVE